MKYKISLSSVAIPEETYGMMEMALRQGKIGQSEYVEQLEEAVANFVGAKYCVSISNGTMADAVAVAAMKEMYGVKRAVVPALTFIAQPNSVRYNELEVVFADVREDWCMDVDAYLNRCGEDRQTILFYTDLMGRKMDTKCDMPTIEDACEAFGTADSKGYSGTRAMMGTFSFFPSHTISTGEGGAIVTNDADLAYLCRRIRSHGSKSDDPFEKFTFPYPGFNARMTTMQAVLGIALMKHIDQYIAQRRYIFSRMKRLLCGFEERIDERIVPHAYPIGFETETLRNAAMTVLLDAGVECRKFFSCIPMDEKQYLSPYNFPVAHRIAHTHLYVPCHQNMSTADVDYVVSIVCGLPGRAQ